MDSNIWWKVPWQLNNHLLLQLLIYRINRTHSNTDNRPHQTAIRFLLFRIPTIKHPQLCMFSVLRISNIIADRAAPELTTKLCGSFQEVRRYLDKRAVVFYELYAVSPQVLDEVLTRHCPVPRCFPHPRSFQAWSCGCRSCGHSDSPGSSSSDWCPDACSSSCLRVSLYNSSHKTFHSSFHK